MVSQKKINEIMEKHASAFEALEEFVDILSNNQEFIDFFWNLYDHTLKETSKGRKPLKNLEIERLLWNYIGCIVGGYLDHGTGKIPKK